MGIHSYLCPNCGASYNPAQNRCEYCGSYIFQSNENYADLSGVRLELSQQDEAGKYPGVYVFGRLLGAGERPIALGAANFFTGPVAAGGKLLLTNRSLSFSAHAFNVGERETRIELSEVTDVSLAANFLVSQHILVTAGGRKYKFVVFHGQDWIEKIKAAAAACKA